jgi:hypothetical protein
MKLKDHGNQLATWVERSIGFIFDDNSHHAVVIQIKDDDTTVSYWLTADEAIKLARSLLKLSQAARGNA